MVTTKEAKNPLLSHWLCKECEVLNSNHRDVCLQCDKTRKEIQLTDFDAIKKIKQKWGFTPKDKLPGSINSELYRQSNFTNGEYP